MNSRERRAGCGEQPLKEVFRNPSFHVPFPTDPGLVPSLLDTFSLSSCLKGREAWYVLMEMFFSVRSFGQH